MAKATGLVHPRKAKEEAAAKAQQELIDARAEAERYNLTYTEMDTVKDILKKVEKAKKDGVVPAGEAPPEIRSPKIGDAGSNAPVNQKDMKITTEEELHKFQKSGKLVGWGGWKMEVEGEEVAAKHPASGQHGFIPGCYGIARITVAFVFAFMCLLGQKAFASANPSDHGQLGDSWSVQDDGDIVPYTDSAQDIGASGSEVANFYVDSITFGNGGGTVTSAGQISSAWTDTGLTTTLNGAPTKFIATHSSGDFAATGLTAGTGDLTLENGQTVDGGTNNSIKFGDNGDTFNVGWDGSETTFDSSDGGIDFIMTQSDGHVTFKTDNDNDDYLVFTTVANVPTIVTAGTSNLTIAPDGGTTTITGALTASGLVTSAGLTSSSTITLANAETIANATNQIVRVSSNAASPFLEVYDPGTSDTNACVRLTADAAGDNGDKWDMCSQGSDNAFVLMNDTTGSMVAKWTLTKNGGQTFGDDLTLENGEYIDNDTTDDTVGIHSDDEALILKLYGYDAKAAALVIAPDRGDDAADSFKFSMDTSDLMTMTTGSTTAATVSTAGLWTFPDITVTTNILGTALTASRFVATDGSKVLASTAASAALSATLSDETGSGVAVFATTPTLVTPVLGTATGTQATWSGNSYIQTSLMASGAYAPAGVGTSITLNSSSTGLGGSSVPYKLIIKNIGGAGVDSAPGSILANGLAGQTLYIMTSGVGSGTCQWLLTPTTKTGYTSITFTATKQFAVLNYDATLGWVLGTTNATVNL